MVFIRSFLFQIYLYVSVLFASILVVLAFPLPYSVKFSIARKWGASMLWVGEKVCSIKFVVEGQENIPLEPSVIMIKHSSVFEAYAQLVVFPEQTWVVKRELQWIPIFGWALSALNAISINRRSGRTAVTQVIEEGNKRLRDGIWITIFPDKPVTARAAESRMGSGKGTVDYWVAVIKPGTILFELAGIIISLKIYFNASATVCNNPKGPTTFGPFLF